MLIVAAAVFDSLAAPTRLLAARRTYPSALATYRRLGDDKPLPWKDANATVNRIGGWRAYAREAQQPEPAASTPATRNVAPSASGTTPAQGAHKPY